MQSGLPVDILDKNLCDSHLVTRNSWVLSKKKKDREFEPASWELWVRAGGMTYEMSALACFSGQ